MYLLIAGGGKVGSNLARTLIRTGHEVTLIEQRLAAEFDMLEAEFEHQVHKGDATELFVLERAGIQPPAGHRRRRRPATTRTTSSSASSRASSYGVEKVIARVNDPRNQSYFDLLGITPTVSATRSIMALIEHEVPEHGLIHLLELKQENLEIVEVTVGDKSDCAGKTIRQVALPLGSRADLGRAQRQGRDPGRRDAARARRLRARDPRARQGGRAAPGARQGVGRSPVGAISPAVLAWATALVGLVAIVSAATPELADRSRIVRSVLSNRASRTSRGR